MTERLRIDALSAIRALRQAPSTVASAVLTLAVAVGLNLAMFSLIDRALLSPPAHVADPDRVFTLGFEVPGTNGAPGWMTTTSYVTFDAIREHVDVAADTAAWQRSATSVVVDGMQVATDAMLVSGSYFSLLGARPLLGRIVLPDDDLAPAGSTAAVISHGFWKNTFGGDLAVIGRRIFVRGIEFTIAGVMPVGFSGHSAARVDVWVPFHAAMRGSPGWDHDRFRNVAGILMRLSRANSAAVATAQASTAIERKVTLFPIIGAEVTSAERRIAYWLAGVSILVLVLGVANTSTLLLVRGAGRRRDLAIRTALGATRGRLLSQVLLEAALLATAALMTAMILSYWLDEAVRRVLLPSVVQGAGVAGFRTVGVAMLAGLAAFIAAAAAGIAQVPAPDYLHGYGLAGATRGRPQPHVYTALLLVQTTLSVLLLAGAGMFARSLYNLVSQDLGMRMDDVVLVQFEQGPGTRAHDELLASALDRIRALPGVQMATPIQQMPFTGFHVPPISVPGLADPPNVDRQLPYLIAATPELLDILGVTIIEGRRFVDNDARGAPVVIVNESMARTVWPGQTAVGKCIRIGFEPSFDPLTADGPPPPPTTVPCREVIGVARNVRQRSIVPNGSEARLMQYFVPFSQVPPPPAAVGQAPGIAGLLLRVTTGPEVLAAPIQRLVLGGRTDLPFLHVRRYSDLLEGQMRPWRLGTLLLSLFGALALGVAAVGLYAAFAHSVAERRREMAIRIAIGARSRAVLFMVLSEAARVAAAGVICGCILSAIGGRWLQSMLFGTAPSDSLVLGSAALIMLMVATLATLVPARRASRANPGTLLRAE